ncbi:MAG: peptidase [Steroidobacteraceae bacterium]|jgi:murein DD-endopeptidase MepM/ murein hydrolase activator NlpD|nr:peptidase [Steroidobacteraceae bacterium]
MKPGWLFVLFAASGAAQPAPVFSTGWPVTDGHLSSGFGGKHQGMDIAAAVGTPVRAFAAGIVEALTPDKVCGRKLRIRHDFGATSTYCHVSGIQVSVGDSVALGQPLAEIAPGIGRTRAHLHFELKIAGEKVDPLAHLPRAR